MRVRMMMMRVMMSRTSRGHMCWPQGSKDTTLSSECLYKSKLSLKFVIKLSSLLHDQLTYEADQLAWRSGQNALYVVLESMPAPLECANKPLLQ